MINQHAHRQIYRQYHHGEDLTYFTVNVEQTNLHIGAKKNLKELAEQTVNQCRNEIVDEIKRNEHFLSSLVPIDTPQNATTLITKMYQAAKHAKTGPMAAVAGAVAEQVAMQLAKQSEEVIVENGGDICLVGKKTRSIGIFAGKSPLNNRLAIEVNPNGARIGICTSSGTIGHSFSEGKVDAAVVISNHTPLADAVATQLGNLILKEEDIQKAIEWAYSVQGVLGAIAIMNEKIGAIGQVKLKRMME